jgi:3-oxoacyl-[acyl-carrier-protein] synthase II
MAVPGRRRVAITGVGVVSCCGIGKDAFFDGLCSAAPEGEHRVHDFDPSPWLDVKQARRAD